MSATTFLKEFLKAGFIGTLIFLVLALIQFATGNFRLTWDTFWYEYGINQMYSISLYLVNVPFFNYMISKYGSDLFKFKRLSLAFLGTITITLSCLFFVNMFIVTIIRGGTVTGFLENQQLDYYWVGLLIAVVVTGIFYAVYYYKHKKETQVQQQKIIAKTASAQFDALKNQLDPHFLFNSLNVLTSLIEENPQAATKFTTALSKVYRYVLEQKNKELVTVEEELKFARLYMSLIKMRFEDSISFTAPENVSNPEAKVVPLSLQLLLENAVKHNQVTPSKKLHISIFEKDGNLVIQNNLQPKKILRESSGVGLQNIYQRYGLLTQRPVLVEKSAAQFTVTIPMLTNVSVVPQNQETYISEKRMERAKEYVEKLKGFYIHLTIYCIFIPVFIWLNYRSNAGFPWAIFPIVGWGFGVMGHASETFDWNPFFNKSWEERKIKQFMDDEN
ncbi:2TM domain-containing protein [Marinirhabdus gelatinilytica]|uniref:Histidine kinase n=1 Tax=Marinirhabdus gelatinilytica TaxID=1703343 RepID=A0A370QFI8_9FLAO|nr:2TM domain-containing protein [Marinirhabdus gelatinilytica]RDK87138.1 histidine kinase [Marinirhabdus gelatinilytica]